MKTQSYNWRLIERRTLFFVTIVLSFGFLNLQSNFKRQFSAAEAGYSDTKDSPARALNLQKGFDEAKLARLLVDGGYVSDEKDAQFIARHIAERLDAGKTLPNLGALNKKAFLVLAARAAAEGGEGLKKRVDESLRQLGVPDVREIYGNVVPGTKQADAVAAAMSITVNVVEKAADASGESWMERLLHQGARPVPGVVVRLTEHFYDEESEEIEPQKKASMEDVAWGMTDSRGEVTFQGLEKGRYYSVVPIREGFEYGSRKGTSSGALREDMRFDFTQNEHVIRMFDSTTYSRIKGDTALTVRTPAQFKSNLMQSFILFLVAWWGLHVYLCARRKSRERKDSGGKDADGLLLPVLMTLSGLCVLLMFAIVNPLTDMLLGPQMVIGVFIGVVLIAIVSEVDFVKFYSDQYHWLGWCRKRFFDTGAPLRYDFALQFLAWATKPFPQKIRQLQSARKRNVNLFYLLYGVGYYLVAICCLPVRILGWFYGLLPAPLRRLVEKIRLPIGSTYLILALALAMLLYFFGSGPEGSGVKINLFGVTLSELNKFLILFFFAAYFFRNAKAIQIYAQTMSWRAAWAQFKTVLPIFLGLLALLGVYLVLLGDMGPALVLGVTFILIYSVARRDFPQLIVGVVSLALPAWFAAKYDGGQYLGALVLVWFGAWIGIGLVWKRKLFESAIFMNMVIVAFMFGGGILTGIGMEHAGQRLQDRVEMSAHPWDNELPGAGDQVAQGVWSLASGGLFGQGLGEGNPNLTPAFHTDMIFASVGEEMGWLGLLLVILCLAILLHRALLIGERAGSEFAFYLATGIAVVTGVQFLVITLGGIGLIPLTGVSSPFLSYGKTSLILNLAAFGVVLSLSRRQATAAQEENIEKYKYMYGMGIFSYSIASVVILAFLLGYQFFARDTYLIKPAYVTTRAGERFAEYNPRIDLLMRKLHSGNIYDRNGLLLATSDKAEFEKKDVIEKIATAGIGEAAVNRERAKYQRRYYPFGADMFFMLGDYNTTVLWNDSEDNPYGYLAEHRHLAALRGFDNLKYVDKDKTIISKKTLAAKKQKGSPFLDPVETAPRKVVTDYDYSALLPMLRAGLDSDEVKRWNSEKNREDRDIYLTVDAALQTRLQNALRDYMATEFPGAAGNKLRVSVVALNAKTGDLLCSANYPLPDQDLIKEKMDQKIYVYDEKDPRQKAYTDRDLGLTFQTAPGSTAKIMSALAGLRKNPALAGKTYFINRAETIEYGIEPAGHPVSMEEAIAVSSNCYFVNLVNDQDLYQQLADIYATVGIRIDGKDTKTVDGKVRNENVFLTPYFLNYGISEDFKDKFTNTMLTAGRAAVNAYRGYVERRKGRGGTNFERMAAGSPAPGQKKGTGWMQEHNWAWGQGPMGATPLNLARVAAIIANGGEFVPTRFIREGINNEFIRKDVGEPVRLVREDANRRLNDYMQAENTKWRINTKWRHRGTHYSFPAGANMGGKTGTPERELRSYRVNSKTGKKELVTAKPNDGWYVFFVDSPKCGAPLAVAVRMERLGDRGSRDAVQLAEKIVGVNGVLRELEYIQ